MLDLIFASMALFLLSPLLLVISIFVRLTLGSPVIFRQTRPGKDEKLFTLYKFRSMTNQTNKKGELLSDSQRLTKFGRFLRASSLDELLELINIIKGDMSIVGPRPLSIYYLPHYTSTMRKRHQVRPGLTGLAQVSGRNDLPWDERLALDIEYVRNISFLIDLKIIFVTFAKVFGRSNVSIRGTTSIKDFGPYSVIKEQGKTHMRINDMTYSEIGSYWWLEGDNFKEGNTLRHFDWLPVVDDFAFSFSGRAAISIALQDIMMSLNIKKAYVPSYSCVSMLQPFVDYGIPLVFYDVHYDDGFTYHVPQIDNDSVALVMNYFGIETHKVKNVIMDFKQQGAALGQQRGGGDTGSF
jgi:undecaprenyl phosphate N,N'-diacetylbacillosamine 1-phosphate transferase